VLAGIQTRATVDDGRAAEGSSSGLGAIHAQRLARCGYDVLLVAGAASRLAARAGDIFRMWS